jgi:hypothetical protein
MPAKLICVKGPCAGQEFVLGSRGAVIGRDPASAGIVLDLSTISRSHANVFVAPDGRVVVQDLGSTNGTWLLGGAGERTKITRDTMVPSGGRFSVGDGDECIFEVAFAAETPAFAASPFAAPPPDAPALAASAFAAPVQANDLWSDSLRILSKIVFVLLILGGISLGCSAWQIVSIGELFGQSLRVFPSLGIKLTAFFVPFGVGVIGAFFMSAQLDMAADIREVRNALIKK